MIQMLTINTRQFKRVAYSFVIAFVFWFFIKSEDTFSVNTNIPLVARNLQEQKTYKEEVPESIFVTLKGSGRSFIWLRLFNSFYEDDFKAVIDFVSAALSISLGDILSVRYKVIKGSKLYSSLTLSRIRL